MKKTFSRAFSLLLVLALLVSVIPAALAAGGNLNVTPGATEVQSGGSTTISAVASDSADLSLAVWDWNADNCATVTGNANASFTAPTVERDTDVTVTVTATIKATEPEGSDTVYSGNCVIKVKAPVQTVAGVTVAASPTTVKVGEKVNLTATLDPTGATGDIEWSVEPTAAGSVTGTGTSAVFTAAKAGDATIKATVNGVSGTAAVTVEKAAITATKAADATVLVGNTVSAAVSGLSNLPDGTVKIEYSSNKQDVATVDAAGMVTGVKTGDAVITATVTLLNTNDYTLTSATNNQVVYTTNIQVKNSGVLGGPISVEEGKNAYITLSVSDKNATGEKFTKGTETATGASATLTISGNTLNITNTVGEGSIVVPINAEYEVNNKKVTTSGSVTIYVYQDHDVRITINKDVVYIHEEGTMSYASFDGSPLKNLSTMSIRGVLSANNGNSYKLGTVYEPVGTFNDDDFTNYSKDVFFTATKSGTQRCSYTVYAVDGSTVSTGTLYLTVGDVTSDITYSTNYSTSITFDEDDFENFWTKAHRNNSALTGSLSYVTFNVNSSYPQYGSLKTSKNGSSVSYAMKFEPNYVSSSKNYDLDTVTYVPNSTMKAETTVTIPFTAYSTTGKSVTGTVSIDLNKETTTITSYGVGFGNGTNSIADSIADTYKTNTNATLGYVTFPNITASTGKLFYDFSGVLKSREVLSTYKFYAKPTGTQFDLDDVVFVPRAGLYGEVTLYYYAYDASGNNEYKGTIVLNVQQKTKSAEFSDVGTSYSWAADSVDFLNYEGVAQGSNGKYRPTANITRGDFMLMLYRAFLEDEHKNDSITSNFSDVTKGSDTYSKETYQAVGVAKKLGIAQGTNGKFNPKSYITRQEAMTLIYRTLDEVNYGLDYTVSATPSSFKDYSSVASYAKTAISDLIGHGIVIGNNSKINPTSNITRAEMAVILHRVLTY